MRRFNTKKSTDFTKNVIRLIKRIPKGKVATYGQLAKLAGKPQGSRGVAWILHSSSHTQALPWHRVVNSKGCISFPAETESFIKQKARLERERIKFDNKDKISLKKFQWKA
ncbi:MAG: MGMT family protein [Bacteriovoracaceae bacterium]|nr:MGMT family protein [Bacteriovoracaceae bacterium]